MSNSQTTTGIKSDSMKEPTHRVQEALQELGRAGRDAASEVIGVARDSATDRLEKGKKKAMAARDQVAGYISDNPVKSVLIASAAGAVLGAFLARRR